MNAAHPAPAQMQGLRNVISKFDWLTIWLPQAPTKRPRLHNSPTKDKLPCTAVPRGVGCHYLHGAKKTQNQLEKRPYIDYNSDRFDRV